MSSKRATDKPQTQAEIDALRERHDIALRAANVGTWTWHVNAGHVEIDPYTEAVFGIEQGSFDGQMESWPKLMHPDDSAAALAAIALCGKDGTPFEVTYRLPQADGSERWLKTRGEATARDAKGHVLRVAGGTWDVTAEICAQQQAKAALERIEETTKYSGMGMWELDAASQTMRFDTAWKQLTGIPQSAVVDVDYLAAQITPADMDNWLSQTQTALTDGGDVNIEFGWRRPDNGQQMYLRARGATHRDDQGNITGVRGVAIDETEQQAAREEKEAAQVQVEEASSMSGTGFWQIDAASQTVTFDPEWKRRTGIPESAVVDVDYVLAHLAAADVEPYLKQLQPALLGDAELNIEFGWQRPDNGEHMYLRARGATHRDDQGNITGVRGVAIDETEQQAAREEKEAAQMQVEEASSMSGTGFWQIDAATLKVDFNAGWLAVAGIPESAQVSMEYLLQHMDPGDLEKFQHALGVALQVGGAIDTSFRWIRPEGGEFMYIRARGAAKRNANGQIMLLRGIAIDETEAYYARQQSDELLARVNAALASGKVGFWSFNPAGPNLDFTSELRHTLGLPESGLIPASDAIEQTHPDDRAWGDSVAKTLADGTPLNESFRWHHGITGEIVYVRAYGMPRRNAAGEITSAVGVSLDETEQMQLRTARDTLLARMRHASRTFGIGFWQLDATTLEIEFDQDWLHTMGVPPDTEVTVAYLLNYIVPKDVAGFQRDLQATLKNAGELDTVFGWQRPDNGEVMTVRARGRAQTDAQGNVTGIDGLTIDETEQTRLRAARDASQAKVDQVLDTGLMGFWSLDAETGTFDLDRGWLKTIGYDPDLQPENAQALVEQSTHPDDRELLFGALQTALASGNSFDDAFRYLRADTGEVRHCRGYGNPVRDTQGKITGLVGFIVDIEAEARALQAAENALARVDEAAQGGKLGFWNIDAATGEFESAAHALKCLTQDDLSLALDDFGTGYSSLSMLTQLPIDTLKIDRSFVENMGDDPRAEALIRSLITLGNDMGMTIIAEGVETEIQHQQLIDYGCRIGQGYLYGYPGNHAALASQLADGAPLPEAHNKPA